MVTCTETHLWISQPNWYLFYKYKKLLSQKQNLCVDKSSQTNVYLQPSWRTHEQRCCNCGFGMTSQLMPLTLSERTSHIPRNDAIWDLRHDLRHDLRRDLTESRWFSFVNTTWLGPGPSLRWDSVRVQAKSWVKSQVKTVSEYGPWPIGAWVVFKRNLEKVTVCPKGNSKCKSKKKIMPVWYFVFI